MARDRDDDRYDRDDDRYDRDDDRPRRRRDEAPAKKGGGGAVLLIVLLAVGIPLLVCGGVVVYFVYVASQVVASVKQGIEQFAGSVQATQEADTFLDLLETAPDSAYARTTPNFQKTMTKEQFTKMLKDHPVLTSQHYTKHNVLPTPTGTAPNRTVSFTTTVIAGVDPNPDRDITDGTSKKPSTAPKPTPPTTPSTAPKPKDVTVTITLVEQAGSTWKVDGFTVQ